VTAQREWLEKNYYSVLGVDEKADAKEIQRAYRKLARQYHPDAEGGDESRFKEVSAAYEVVGDEAKRKEYDELRRLGPIAGGFAGGRTSDGGYQIRFEDVSDFGGLGDLFGGLFGGRGGSRARQQPQGPRPGPDTEASLTLGFLEAVQGLTTEVLVDGETVRVRIPPGVGHGQRIRLRGKGRPGLNGGPNGDLYVVVQVEDHARFGRKGNDLTVTVPITFGEATLGGDITVPTLDGDTVTVRIPAGTRSGRTFRVKGRGVERRETKGDLLATVEIAVPRNLSRSQRKAVEAMETALELDPRGDGASTRKDDT
jgi:molecular chaperone DnaJ